MKVGLIMAGVLMAAAGTSAEAQSCAAGTAQDACQKAIDIVNFLTPQLATANAGGNATLAQGGALGGLGHWAVDIRGTAVNGKLPELSGAGLSTAGAKLTNFSTKSQFMPGVSANAAIGIWRGYSLGVTHVGGIDALVTATYLPNVENSDVTLQTSGGNTKFGYGVRIGVLEESAVTPGIGITYLQRDLPTLSVIGRSTVAAGGTTAPGDLTMSNLAIKTTAWRITAAKDLLILNLNAGIGQDKYSTSTSISATVRPSIGGPQTATASAGFDMTRTNMFVGASLNLFIAKLVGEIGQVSGGTAPKATNTFSGSDAGASRTYFTLGLRVGF